MSRYTLFFDDKPVMHSDYLAYIEYAELIFKMLYHDVYKISIAEDLTYKIDEVNRED